jgi:hypothetical protein
VTESDPFAPLACRQLMGVHSSSWLLQSDLRNKVRCRHTASISELLAAMGCRVLLQSQTRLLRFYARLVGDSLQPLIL